MGKKENDQQAKKRIVLSAGGTGGHVMPARALARDLLSRGFAVDLITDTRGAKYKDLFSDIPVHVISSGTLGAGFKGKIVGGGKLAVGLLQSYLLLNKLKPSVVVGFGGYPSFPAVYSAQKKGIPTVIHEQNAVIGKANKYLAPKADRIAISLPKVTGLDNADQVRSVVTGNPVRSEIAALYNQPYPLVQDDDPLTIFIVGGSLGASVFSDIVPEAMARLEPEYKTRLNIIQQCRKESLDQVREFYHREGIKAELASFFDNVPDILGRSHLVIGRAGASTISEVTTAGRPAIFVPATYHADHQQKINAESVADVGGAWVMTEDGFTPEALAEKIEMFLQNPQILFNAAENARSCGRPDAALKLGNLVTALASGWNKG